MGTETQYSTRIKKREKTEEYVVWIKLDEFNKRKIAFKIIEKAAVIQVRQDLYSDGYSDFRPESMSELRVGPV